MVEMEASKQMQITERMGEKGRKEEEKERNVRGKKEERKHLLYRKRTEELEGKRKKGNIYCTEKEQKS